MAKVDRLAFQFKFPIHNDSRLLLHMLQDQYIPVTTHITLNTRWAALRTLYVNRKEVHAIAEVMSTVATSVTDIEPCHVVVVHNALKKPGILHVKLFGDQNPMARQVFLILGRICVDAINLTGGSFE